MYIHISMLNVLVSVTDGNVRYPPPVKFIEELLFFVIVVEWDTVSIDVGITPTGSRPESAGTNFSI
jgi:hypothetical protein